ncbi:MAG: YfhO family protein [Planctomycetota bacterium]
MAAAILVATALLAQGPLLLGMVQPGAATGEAAVNGDIVLPTLADAATVLAGGEWPWWNPFARLGEPFMASGAQPLYPGFWPILFGGVAALPWVLALHSALACVLMFRWLRALPASRYAAFLGGGLWGIGIFFQLQLLRLPEAAACAWLPLALEGTWRTTRPGRTPPYVAAIALGLAAMFATGAHATPRVGTGLCMALGAWNMLGLHRADRLPTLGHLGLAGVGACLLAAPFWLDAWQNASVLEHGRTPGGSVPTLVSALAPVSAMPGVQPRTDNDALELALFPGTIVLLLLVMAFLRPSPSRPRWPWLAIAAVGFLAATEGPWSLVLREQLALDGRLPGCSLILLQLGVLVLACQGLDGFLETPFRRPAVALGVAASALMLGGGCIASLLLYPRALSGWFARVRASTDDPAVAAVTEAVTQALLPTAVALVLLGITLLAWRRLGVLRLKVTLACIVFAEMVYLAWATAPQRVAPPEVDIVGTGDARVLATDVASAVRLARGRAPARRVNRTGDAVLRRTRAFLDEAAPGSLRVGARVRGSELDPQHFLPTLANLAQIDVLIGDRAPGAAPFPMPAGPEHRPLEPAPYARLVFQAKVAADTEAARQDLRTRSTPIDSVVLEGNLGAFAPRAPLKPATVAVVEQRSGRLRLHVDAGQGRGILVVADAFAPGWTATVDSEPVPIFAADVAFRGVTIPEGEHDIEMVYAPWAKRWGLPLAGLGLLFVLACFVRLRRHA